LQTQRHVVVKTASARSHRSHTFRPRQTAAPIPAQAVTRTIALGAATTVSRAGRARPGNRWHTVRSGESLWSIGSDVLGGRASSARVAAEVKRLWERNRKRIGTGDADVLPVGTRLTLR
jgi:Tfp pilus assembly protein FimV